jgi:hypothetical protein
MVEAGQERAARYNTGWNDVAHGILTWQPHEKWQSALEWALEIREIGKKCKDGGGDADYYDGTIAAVNQYQQTGRIERKPRLT